MIAPVVTLAQKIDTIIEPLRAFTDKIGAPVFDLIARLYLANAFFSSGILRLKDFLNGNGGNQFFLFELEHPVPGLSPEFAAYIATTGEIILPILLVLGLFGRFAAAGLLIMTAVIEFTYGHFDIHILWAFLALSILIRGPSLLSADHFLLKFLRRQHNRGTRGTQ